MGSENAFNDFSNAVNSQSENFNERSNASNDFLNRFNGEQMTNKCFKALNGKALMYIFLWKVTYPMDSNNLLI